MEDSGASVKVIMCITGRKSLFQTCSGLALSLTLNKSLLGYRSRLCRMIY